MIFLKKKKEVKEIKKICRNCEYKMNCAGSNKLNNTCKRFFPHIVEQG